jgi:hypothetical protein
VLARQTKSSRNNNQLLHQVTHYSYKHQLSGMSSGSQDDPLFQLEFSPPTQGFHSDDEDVPLSRIQRQARSVSASNPRTPGQTSALSPHKPPQALVSASAPSPTALRGTQLPMPSSHAPLATHAAIQDGYIHALLKMLNKEMYVEQLVAVMMSTDERQHFGVLISMVDLADDCPHLASDLAQNSQWVLETIEQALRLVRVNLRLPSAHLHRPQILSFVCRLKII